VSCVINIISLEDVKRDHCLLGYGFSFAIIRDLCRVSNTRSSPSYDTHLISCTVFLIMPRSTTNATPKASHQSYRLVRSGSHAHDSLTYQNRRIKQKKNPTQTFQPTPVFSAMRSIRFIVPRNRFLVPSNWSFIFSARAVESLISPPIALVNCFNSCQKRNPQFISVYRQLTSFNMRTFPLITPICSSFWLSSSSSTAFEYWPFLFGVAALNPPSPLPLPLSPFMPPPG
jgi:hypothetical protein